MNTSFGRKQIVLFVVLALVIGAFLGVAVLFAFGNQGLLNKVQLSDLGDNQSLVIDSPRTVVVNQDLQISSVENMVVPALVNIYDWRTSTASVVDRALTADRRVGQGVVLTADGWMLTTAKALANAKGAYRAVGYQQKEYRLGATIADPAYDLVFAKMEGVNLPVVSLGSIRNLNAGQTAVLVGPRTSSYVVQIVDVTHIAATADKSISSSDRSAKRIIIDRPVTADMEGAILASLKGDVIGIVAAGAIVPIDYIKPVLSNLFANKPLQRPVLGLNYIDLAHIDGFGALADRGALIVGAPVKTSPAFNLVRDGDLVTKVNDLELNTDQGLADLINSYRSGQSIELLIKRATTTVPVVIKLQ